jgi:hypothetical protein
MKKELTERATVHDVRYRGLKYRAYLDEGVWYHMEAIWPSLRIVYVPFNDQHKVRRAS